MSIGWAIFVLETGLLGVPPGNGASCNRKQLVERSHLSRAHSDPIVRSDFSSCPNLQQFFCHLSCAVALEMVTRRETPPLPLNPFMPLELHTIKAG